jgi:hypothetical protein
MSWFKHKPPKYPPHTSTGPVSHPHRTSPVSEKILEEIKKQVRGKTTKSKKLK